MSEECRIGGPGIAVHIFGALCEVLHFAATWISHFARPLQKTVRHSQCNDRLLVILHVLAQFTIFQDLKGSPEALIAFLPRQRL